LFGSAARGEMRTDSDIDFLVDLLKDCAQILTRIAGRTETVVLALGNTLLRDDGVGVGILHALEREAAGDDV
jgi:predicted nucleotidyltransferase